MSAYPYDDEYEESVGEKSCPKCNSETRSRQCNSCEDGFSELDHDCGDDTCCCLNPRPGRCSDCEGRGWHNWCPTCGWDLLEGGYINGVDERTRVISRLR